MDTEVKISQLLEIVPEKLKKLITSYWDLLDMMMYENYPFDFETFEKNAIARCGWEEGFIYNIWGGPHVYEVMEDNVNDELIITIYPLGDKMPFWKIKEGPNNG